MCDGGKKYVIDAARSAYVKLRPVCWIIFERAIEMHDEGTQANAAELILTGANPFEGFDQVEAEQPVHVLAFAESVLAFLFA